MKRDIFLSTFSYGATKEIAAFGIGIEYNQFCISKWLDDEVIDDTLAKMRRQAVKSGVAFAEDACEDPDAGADPDPAKAIVHGPFTDMAPAAFDHIFREQTRLRLEQATAATRKLGLHRMVVHSGYVPMIFDPSWHVKESIGFWQDFLRDKPADFRLYLENVMDEEPELLLDVIEGVDDPRMKICLDVGHVNAISEKPITGWIEKLGPHIHHLHLHNNDGTRDQHAAFDQGTIDMKEVLRAVDACCPEHATLTVESRKCHESIQWLLEQA